MGARHGSSRGCDDSCVAGEHAARDIHPGCIQIHARAVVGLRPPHVRFVRGGNGDGLRDAGWAQEACICAGHNLAVSGKAILEYRLGGDGSCSFVVADKEHSNAMNMWDRSS